MGLDMTSSIYMSRVKVLALILLYSILTAAMLHGFKVVTILWTVHIVQETLILCPKKTPRPRGDLETNFVEQENLVYKRPPSTIPTS